MPIETHEWRGSPDRSSGNPIHESANVKKSIAVFLEKHEEQAFTLNEINENVVVTQAQIDGGGVAQKVGGFIKSAAKKRVVSYFTNQLVAEGHVMTKVRTTGGTERLYYRWRSFD